MTIERFEPLGKRLSHVLVHNGIVYLTGQTAADCTEDVAGQMRQVLTRIDALLAKADTDKSKILFVQVLLKRAADYAAMNVVWESWIPSEALPARATLEGRFTGEDILVELIVQATVFA